MKNNFTFSLVAYFQGFYFILSLVKLVLGEPESTLMESFWDMTYITYLHYGIPLAIISIIAPFILRKIKYLNDKKILSSMASLVMIEVVLEILPTGKISNEVYCIGFIIACMVSVTISLVYKKDFVFYSKNEYKVALKDMFPLFCGFILVNGLFLPNELYLGNSGEFAGAYNWFVVILFITSLLMLLALMFVELFIMPKGMGYFVNLILAGTTILGYAQNMFLNGKLNSLDGETQEWSVGRKLINSVVWLLVLGAFIFVGYAKKGFLKAVKVICIYIVLIQMVSGIYLYATSTLDNDKTQMVFTTENSLEVADGKNVFVFVMDRFDSSWMQALCDEDMGFFEPLADFTFYNNATSEFANTGTGIPYLLTGVEWNEENGSQDNYARYAYANTDFLKSMKEKGYDLGIYTSISYVGEGLYDDISNFSDDAGVKYNIINTVYTMWKASLYKTSPFGLKNIFVYYSDDINEMVEIKDAWNTENDYPFCESVFKDKLNLSDEYENAFRFYHMHGAHDPYILSEDLQCDKTSRGITLNGQIKGCFNIIYEYLNQLKMLGVYDDATIIITADHGRQIDFQEDEGKPNMTSSPVIIVKRAGDKGDVMRISSTPVTHEEMMATLAQEAGLDYYEYGVTLEEVDDTDERERTFIKSYPEYIKYTITGNVQDLNNWRGERLDD